jgi:hypothetical protein
MCSKHINVTLSITLMELEHKLRVGVGPPSVKAGPSSPVNETADPDGPPFYRLLQEMKRTTVTASQTRSRNSAG